MAQVAVWAGAVVACGVGLLLVLGQRPVKFWEMIQGSAFAGLVVGAGVLLWFGSEAYSLQRLRQQLERQELNKRLAAESDLPRAVSYISGGREGTLWLSEATDSPALEHWLAWQEVLIGFILEARRRGSWSSELLVGKGKPLKKVRHWMVLTDLLVSLEILEPKQQGRLTRMRTPSHLKAIEQIRRGDIRGARLPRHPPPRLDRAAAFRRGKSRE